MASRLGDDPDRGPGVERPGMSWGDIILLRPLCLLALPVLAIVAWLLWLRRGGLDGWDKAGDPDLMAAMATLGRIAPASGQEAFLAPLGTVCIVVLALAGPAVERRDTLSYRNLDGVLFLIDASDSVTADPRWPELMMMGRFGLGALGTRPGGLIVYAGDAYVAADMTLDHLQLGQTLSLIDQTTVPDKGSRPERALSLAIDLLKAGKVIAGDVVLFSDGDGLGGETLKAARLIAELGARLSVVSPIATPDLLAHSATGGVKVFTLDDTLPFEAWLAEDARTRLERQNYPLLFWKDYGRYLLFLAIPPFLLMFRRTAG